MEGGRAVPVVVGLGGAVRAKGEAGATAEPMIRLRCRALLARHRAFEQLGRIDFVLTVTPSTGGVRIGRWGVPAPRRLLATNPPAGGWRKNVQSPVADDWQVCPTAERPFPKHNE